MDDEAVRVRDWSSLPVDILSLVLRGLNNTETDRRRLRSVCTSWRSLLFPPHPPLQFPLEVVLPVSEPPSSSCYCSFKTAYLQQSVFYLIASPALTDSSSSSVWLARVKELQSWCGSPNLWILQNPISSADVFQPMPELKAKINFLDCRISEVARSYSLPLYGFSDAPKSVKIARSIATDIRNFS